MAFMDIMPVTAGHLLVIPLEHAESLAELDSSIGAHLFSAAQHLAAGIRNSGLKAQGIKFLFGGWRGGWAGGLSRTSACFSTFRRDGFELRFGPEYGQPVGRERLEREARAISQAAQTA
jgi:histidine triad (HIT) family protein